MMNTVENRNRLYYLALLLVHVGMAGIFALGYESTQPYIKGAHEQVSYVIIWECAGSGFIHFSAKYV
jgi:hypothetical protein